MDVRRRLVFFFPSFFASPSSSLTLLRLLAILAAIACIIRAGPLGRRHVWPVGRRPAGLLFRVLGQLFHVANWKKSEQDGRLAASTSLHFFCLMG